MFIFALQRERERGDERKLGTPDHRVVRQTLDRHWTVNPIFVQALSNLCPMSVHVQGLSVHCQTNPKGSTMYVKAVSSPTELGQTLYLHVQVLSILCPQFY